MFVNQCKLQRLVITNNKNIKTLSPKLFSRLFSLQHLNLSNNEFDKLDDSLFNNLYNIREINLFYYEHLKEYI